MRQINATENKAVPGDPVRIGLKACFQSEKILVEKNSTSQIHGSLHGSLKCLSRNGQEYSLRYTQGKMSIFKIVNFSKNFLVDISLKYYL